MGCGTWLKVGLKRTNYKLPLGMTRIVTYLPGNIVLVRGSNNPNFSKKMFLTSKVVITDPKFPRLERLQSLVHQVGVQLTNYLEV